MSNVKFKFCILLIILPIAYANASDMGTPAGWFFAALIFSFLITAVSLVLIGALFLPFLHNHIAFQLAKVVPLLPVLIYFSLIVFRELTTEMLIIFIPAVIGVSITYFFYLKLLKKYKERKLIAIDN